MNFIRHTFIYSIISFSLLLTAGQSSFADGGGSGGGIPSQSAPSFDPVEKYQEGLAHLKAQQYKKAQRAFKKVLSVSKKDSNSHYYLGLSYYAEDKAKKALKPLKKAIKYNENNILAVGYLGAAYQKLDKVEEANQQQQVLESLKASCDNCAKQGDINKALELIENATQGEQASLSINIKPLKKGDDAYLDAVKSINQKDYLTALSSLEQSAYSFGPHPDILTYQGFANRKLGNRDLAFSYYQQALTVDQNHLGANEYLGEYYVEIGDLASANKQLSKLEKICDFGCEEAEELRRWIDAANNT